MRERLLNMAIPLRSLQEFDELLDNCYPRRAALEHELLGQESETISHPGYCQVCQSAATFQAPRPAHGGHPNYREELTCPDCGLNVRQRFMVALMRAALEEIPRGETPRLYLPEQTTPFFQAVKRLFPGAEVTGSEFLDPSLASGQERDGLTHQDLTKLSHADSAFHLVVSNDVFEHICDVEAALRECARVLRPGGALLFSIPFRCKDSQSTRRARLDECADGMELRHILEPAYHFNPVDPEGGSLVFHDFGWDLIDTVTRNGFADAAGLEFYDPATGCVGDAHQLLFAAFKS